jgi:phage gp36-like protein
MAYITLDEAKQYLGDVYESAYMNINTELADDSILSADIDDITATINGYVKQIYDKAITGTEALSILRKVSRQILDYEAHRRFNAAELPEAVLDGNKDAMIRLKDIQSGKLRFIDEVQDSRGSAVSFFYNSADSTGAGRTIFDRNSMAGT